MVNEDIEKEPGEAIDIKIEDGNEFAYQNETLKPQKISDQKEMEDNKETIIQKQGEIKQGIPLSKGKHIKKNELLICLAMGIFLVGWAIVQRNENKTKVNTAQNTANLKRAEASESPINKNYIPQNKSAADESDISKAPSFYMENNITVKTGKSKSTNKRSKYTTEMSQSMQENEDANYSKEERQKQKEEEEAKRSPIAFPISSNKKNSSFTFVSKNDKQNFMNNSQAQSFYSSARLTKSKSRYELKAGDFIPAILITGINSDLPAKTLVAQVRENIYDSITGDYLLIPLGTKIIGVYDANVRWGESRLLVVWQRLIFPNGMSIALDNMQGVDLSGKAGFYGNVDDHFASLLKGVILSSAMGSAAAITTRDNNHDNTWQSKAGEGAGEAIVKIGDKYVQKALGVAPTLTIDQGYRFNIMIDKDLILKPYNKKTK